MKDPRLLFWILALSVAAPACARDDWRDKAFDGRKSSDAPPQAAAAPSVGESAGQDDRVWVVVHAAGRADRQRAADLGLSIEEVSAGSVGGVATQRALAKLQEAGLRVERRLALGFPQEDDAFHDFKETGALLSSIASAHPEFASLVEVGKSYRGLPMTALRFNTSARGAEPSSKPGALFMGTHHAREHLSTEVPLLAAKWLAENSARPEVRKLLETRDIYFAPLMNPDGAEFDIDGGQYRWQRKNLRPNADGTIGTDLNRNYGFHWGESGSSTYPGDDTYRGPRPFSEPETQAVKSFIEARPNLKTMVSYHSYSELVLYPWSYTEEPLPDSKALNAFKAMAQKMAGWTGYTAEASADLYASSGDTCDWAWAERKIFCFTFELTPKGSSGGGFYPGSKAIEPTVQKNLSSVLYLADLADDPYRASLDSAPSARGPAGESSTPPAR